MRFAIKARIQKLVARCQRRRIQPLRTNWHDVRLLRQARGRRLPRFQQLWQVGRLLGPLEKKIVQMSLLVLLVGLVWWGWELVDNHRLALPVRGGRYLEGVVGSPQYINPVFASTNDVDIDIVRLVYSGLIRYDSRHRLVPDLAVKHEISEDGKIYTFELRKDVVWHDGEPFTARDVVFTIEDIQNQQVNSPLLVSFQGVKVEMLDDYTVRFSLTESFPQFLSLLTTGILPEHVWYNIAPDKQRLASYNWQPVGTGPFMFKKLSKDDAGYIYNYELIANDRYYRQPPYLEEIVFRFYPDYEGEAGAIAAFRNKKVSGLSFVPNALRDKVERKYSVLHTLQLPQYTALFFNSDHQPLLAEANVRLALAHATDKRRILQQVISSEGTVIHSPILPGFPGYDPELGKLVFSYEEANKLLDAKWTRIESDAYRAKQREALLKAWEENQKKAAEATTSSTEPGPSYEELKKQAEGDIDNKLNSELPAAQTFYRENKEGKLLELSIVTVESEEYRKAAELIAGFWQSIGVKTNLVFYSARDINREVLKERNYDILLYGEIVGSDPDPYPFWHSSQRSYPGLNLSGYLNRKTDAVIEAARQITDEEKLGVSYKQFQELLLADLPAIFLYMPTYTYVTTNEVRGMSVTRISHPADRLADITSWYMETTGQWQWQKIEKTN